MNTDHICLQNTHKNCPLVIYVPSLLDKTSNEGIFMRYSYEFKQKCVELYRQGKRPDCEYGFKSERRFHDKIREWVKLEDAHGPEALRYNGKNKRWTPEDKYALVARALTGESIRAVATDAGIGGGQLYQWVRKYKIFGYNGIASLKKGRKPKNPDMKKLNINNPRKLEESEYEELIRLRAENAYIKAKNEVIKKRSP